jgi:hypothetical protein
MNVLDAEAVTDTGVKKSIESEPRSQQHGGKYLYSFIFGICILLRV